MTTSSYDLQFLSFCRNYSSKEIPGGTNDQYSREDYKKFMEKIKHLSNSKINEKRAIIDKEIENASALDDEIRDMNQFFINFDNPDKKQQVIENKFPKGYQIQDINNLKLENLNKSAKEFKNLFEKFFTKIKLNENELESIFGSITNYASIVPVSFGLMSIDRLWNLFSDTYFDKTSPSKINFTKKDFFKNEGNTYNTKCNLSESDCNLTKIADFLANGETELVHSNESTNLRTKLISFISSLNKWNVVASVTGGSHKRYRKSRKYKSRKQSRRHIQRRKRTHRHKSRRSRK